MWRNITDSTLRLLIMQLTSSLLRAQKQNTRSQFRISYLQLYSLDRVGFQQSPLRGFRARRVSDGTHLPPSIIQFVHTNAHASIS